MTDEYTIIGSPGAEAAYIFVRNVFVGSGNTWTQQAKLLAADGVFNDRFGTSVTLSGLYAIIGAPQVGMGNNPNPGLNLNYGAAYVFVRQGTLWNQQARLIASDGAGDSRFGSHVSLSGDYAILGSYSRIGSNPTQNAAYVFQKADKSWIETRKIVDNVYESSLDGPAVGSSNGTFIIGNSGFQSGKGKVSFGVVE